MTFEELNEYMNRERVLIPGSEENEAMHSYSAEAIKITSELNTKYHTPEEITEIMSELTGKKVSSTFRLFPPFYSDYGKNITLGENVFINSACQFQDQGGITIGDNAFIGPKVVIATINHGIKVSERPFNFLKPVKIGKNVWIGSSVNILPGVTIGDNCIIGAGAVVTKDIPENSIAVGVPAKVVDKIEN